MEKMVDYSFNVLKEFYKGKKVFVTGHTGFKGSWLIKILSILGADVKGYALQPERKEDLFNLIEGDRICNSVIGDVRNYDKLSESIISYQPDFIFHLAAQPLVKLSYEKPLETFEVNLIGTANVLNGLKKVENACSVVIITTDKVYHNYEWFYPYRESDRLGGYDPYSSSKACAELAIDSFRNSFFPITHLKSHKKYISVGRAGNVIGGGDWSENRLIPDIAKALGRNEKIIIRNPNSVRPWQHVLEPIHGYLMLAIKAKEDPSRFNTAFNFGPHSDSNLPVIAMVEKAVEIWGDGKIEIHRDEQAPHEAGLLRLDISRAINELQWAPKLSSDEAIRQTIHWYKTYYAKPQGLIDLTEKQILDYLN